MAICYSRNEFLNRLRKEIHAGKPLVMASAGNGLAAKFIERGGVDILGVYNTGYLRMQGYGSLAGMLPMADANGLVFEMGRKEVLPQAREVPVVAGLNGVEVLRAMKRGLEEGKHSEVPAARISPRARGLRGRAAGRGRQQGGA